MWFKCFTLLLVAACILEIASAQESATTRLLQRQRLLASRRAKLLQERLDGEKSLGDSDESEEAASPVTPRQRVVQRKRVKTSRKVVLRTTTQAPTTPEPTTTEAPTTEFTFVPEPVTEVNVDFDKFADSVEEIQRENEGGEASQEEDFFLPAREVEPEEPTRPRVVVPVRRVRPIAGPRRRPVTTPTPVEEEFALEPVTPQVSRPRVKSLLRQEEVTSRPVKPSTSAPFVETIRRYSFEEEDGSFTFGYENADGSFKEETRGADCIVRGKYGYVDPDGEKREFTYESGNRCDPTQKDSEEEEDEFDNGSAVNTPRPVTRVNTPRPVTRVNTPRPVTRVNTPRTVARINPPRPEQPLPTSTRRPFADAVDSLSFSAPSFSQTNQRQRPTVAVNRPVVPQNVASFQSNPTSIDFDAEVQRLSGSVRRPAPEAPQRGPPPAPVRRPVFDDDEEPEFIRTTDQESERSTESSTVTPVRSTTPIDFSSFGPSSEQTQRLRQQLEQRRRIQEQEEEQQRRIQEQNRIQGEQQRVQEEQERIRQDNERRQQAFQQPRPQQAGPQQAGPQQTGPQQTGPQQFRPQPFAGPQQFGGPQQFAGPQQFRPQQFPGPQQFEGSQQFRPQQFEGQPQAEAQRANNNGPPPPPFNPNFAFGPSAEFQRQQQQQQFSFGGQRPQQQFFQQGRQQPISPPQAPALPPPQPSQSALSRPQPVAARPVSVNGQSFSTGQIDSFLKSFGA